MMRTSTKEFNADFTCKQCGYMVSAYKAFSGVVNRNHCPYCLYSQHVDLFAAGDRLCACKGLMKPVGLTIKKKRDKYAKDQQGELMLVHRCTECGQLSINRIAADDDPCKLVDVFSRWPPVMQSVILACQQHGILLLKSSDWSLVHTRLFGNPSGEPAKPVTVH
jgi:hypothetical protein